MKKSKKFIISLLVILVVAIGVLLAFPDLFDSGDVVDPSAEVENVDDIENPFD